MVGIRRTWDVGVLVDPRSERRYGEVPESVCEGWNWGAAGTAVDLGLLAPVVGLAALRFVPDRGRRVDVLCVCGWDSAMGIGGNGLACHARRAKGRPSS